MSENQFGRVENLDVYEGQPLRGPATRIVRSGRFSGRDGGVRVPIRRRVRVEASGEGIVELEQLQHGFVVRLEFKRGLPCLLETASAVTTDK